MTTTQRLLGRTLSVVGVQSAYYMLTTELTKGEPKSQRALHDADSELLRLGRELGLVARLSRGRASVPDGGGVLHGLPVAHAAVGLVVRGKLFPLELRQGVAPADFDNHVGIEGQGLEEVHHFLVVVGKHGDPVYPHQDVSDL